MKARMSNILLPLFYSVSGEPHTSLSTPIKDGCPWNSSMPAINNINFFRKQLIKFTKRIIAPEPQYKCNKCDKPSFKKGALTTHIKKAHNMSKNIFKKENFPQIMNQTTMTKSLK